MDYGSKVATKEADKIIGKLSLAPDESATFACKCSNWAPVALEWIIITNKRILGAQSLPAKANWEAARTEVNSAAGDAAKKTVTVETANGSTFTFKKVAPEDHAVILTHLNASLAAPSGEASSLAQPTPTDIVEPLVEEKKEGRFAQFGAAVKQKADEWETEKRAKAAKEAEAQEVAGAAAGDVVHKGSFGGTVVWVYSGGYVRIDDAAMTKWGMSDSARFEKLLSVKFTTMTRDKSSGGRAVGAVMSLGLSTFASNERIESFLAIVTDRKVHKLDCTRAAGLALEAVAQGVIDASRAAGAAQTAVATQGAAPTAAEQLRQLADLHKDGILSDDEFAAAKAKVLGGL